MEARYLWFGPVARLLVLYPSYSLCSLVAGLLTARNLEPCCPSPSAREPLVIGARNHPYGSASTNSSRLPSGESEGCPQFS
jgi:hypothetical protein